MSLCEWCPRMCRIDREAGQVGYCGGGALPRVARAALHPYEEPCISESRGSGTVFFVGCTLRCVFCQNSAISRGRLGKEVTPAELCEIFLSLQAEGAHNINLVTPTHFAEGIIEALRQAGDRLTVPVVYNTSGYERVESLGRLKGLVDIYMPDFKYGSAELGGRYSSAPDYAEVAAEAIREMVSQVGRPRFDEAGLLTRGVMVRHLVLPGHRGDSMAVLQRLSELVDPEDVVLSLMSQYTPEFAADQPYKNLKRRITAFEYESVLDEARRLGFEGYMQGRASASKSFTPEF